MIYDLAKEPKPGVGFVISSGHVWMPGRYESKRAARYAFKFPDEVLVKLRKQSKTRRGVSGNQSNWNGISILIGTDRDLMNVLETLLHELVHAAVGYEQVGKRRMSHGPRFKQVLCEAAFQLWKVDVWPEDGKYDTDWELVRVLKKARQDGDIYPVVPS